MQCAFMACEEGVNGRNTSEKEAEEEKEEEDEGNG